MTNGKFKPLLAVGARIGLAVVFFMAAFPKIMDPAGFATDIENYQILPKTLINLMALTLPWVEFMAALALLLGTLAELLPRSPLGRFQLARGAAFLCLLMLGVFMIAIASAVSRDLDITCGCFGHTGGSKAGYLALLKDAGFVVLALLSLLPIKTPLTPR